MIPIAKPLLGEEEQQAALRPLHSGWVAQGPEVAAFEKEFAAYVGASHACAVSSGTAALHLALKALGVRAGDEVITVSHSFIATANCIRYLHATPVFVDIEADTFNIDPALLEAARSDRTRAILCVHQMGMPCDLVKILAFAGKHGFPVVEDAACAVGSEILLDDEWQPVGRPHGDLACFSFHPRKVLTTGDGGMVTSRSDEVDSLCRRWRTHSMNVPGAERHGSVVFEEYVDVGFNYRMTDIQAAVGREQLKRLPDVVERRRHVAGRYESLLADIPGVVIPSEPAWAHSNWQSYCVRLPEGIDQVEVLQSMLASGVMTKRGIMNAHQEPAYAVASGTSFRSAPGSTLRQSEVARDHCLLLPLYPQMTEAEQMTVVHALRRACS